MWRTAGQDHLLRQLSNALSRGQMGHAYLLVGPPHVGKMTLAMDMAAIINCLDPGADDAAPCGECARCTRIRRDAYADLTTVAVGGDPRSPTRISIEQVRETENFLSVTAVEGGWKVVIFDGCETLSAGQSESANALLKTLEEPPPNVLLLLLTSDDEGILPTIRSRCRLLTLRPMAGAVLADYLVSHHGADPSEARRLARLARGCPGWAINALNNQEAMETRSTELDRITELAAAPLDERFAYANALASSFSQDRESVRQILYQWEGWWRDLLLVKEGTPDSIRNIDRDADLIRFAEGISSVAIANLLRRIQSTLVALDANANPRLALECMMLDVPTN